MYDIIIIGAGTAGMSAGIYGARNNHKTLILESVVPGGQIINAFEVENYPGIAKINGYDYSMGMKKQAENLGAEYKREPVLEVDLKNEIKKVTTKNETYLSKTVIIATGGKPKRLNIKGEETFSNKGVSYCATCDGNFFKNQNVVVVGGGNTALEDVLFLSNICNKVYLVHRRQGFRADENNIAAVKNKKNVELVLDHVVKEIKGDNLITSILVENVLTNKKTTLDATAIFIAIGQVPQSQLFADVIEVDKDGYALVDESCKTDVRGVYVAGDIRKKPLRQLITAAADGATAAIAASNYLSLLD